MNDTANDRIGSTPNSSRLGERIRERIDEVGWNATETGGRLGGSRETRSRLRNGRAGVSADMALALEDIGRGTAEHRMRMQARRERVVAERGASELHA